MKDVSSATLSSSVNQPVTKLLSMNGWDKLIPEACASFKAQVFGAYCSDMTTIK